MNRKVTSGQVVIVILLIMVVALTIGLSISSRTIRDIKVSTRTEESQRAFSAAEAGLEAALLKGADVDNPNFDASTGTAYSVDVQDTGGGMEFAFPGTIARDDTQQVWLVNHDSSGNLVNCAVDCYKGNNIDIFWGNQGSSDDPALEVSIIYKDSDPPPVYKIKKFAFDPDATRRPSNNFSDVQPDLGPRTVGGMLFDHGINVNLPVNNQSASRDNTAIRLRLLYNVQNHVIGVRGQGSFTLPIQGKRYDAEGTTQVGTSNQREVRKVTFFKSFPYLPGIFDFVLFSNTDLSKPQ